MRPLYRQLVTGTLLALYSGIALLGHGLHWLSLEDHHHHGVEFSGGEHHHQAHVHHHGAHHHDHHRHHHHSAPAQPAASDRDRPLGIAASNGAFHAHDCDICAFLMQVRSERPQVLTAIVWQHVVAAAPAPLQRSYSPISLGPHAARGPPMVSLETV